MQPVGDLEAAMRHSPIGMALVDAATKPSAASSAASGTGASSITAGTAGTPDTPGAAPASSPWAAQCRNAASSATGQVTPEPPSRVTRSAVCEIVATGASSMPAAMRASASNARPSCLPFRDRDTPIA